MTKKALPKLEGLKFPDRKSILKGVFSNHLAWIYEPTSLLMLMISYYLYKYVYDNRDILNLDERWAFAIACWVPGVAGYWVLGFGFLLLDTITR